MQLWAFRGETPQAKCSINYRHNFKFIIIISSRCSPCQSIEFMAGVMEREVAWGEDRKNTMNLLSFQTPPKYLSFWPRMPIQFFWRLKFCNPDDISHLPNIRSIFAECLMDLTDVKLGRKTVVHAFFSFLLRISARLWVLLPRLAMGCTAVESMEAFPDIPWSKIQVPSPILKQKKEHQKAQTPTLR